MHRKRLLLSPLDVLFFRDGRPFEAGTRGSGGLATATALLGAVRTHLWRAIKPDIFEGFASRLADCRNDAVAAAKAAGVPDWASGVQVRGPWFCHSELGVLLPMPSDLVREGRKSETGPLTRLRPLETPPPGWNSANGLLPLWHHSKEAVEPAKGYVTLRGMDAWLRGDTPYDTKSDTVSPQALYDWEDRVGIGVDVETRAAEDSKLYSARFLRLRPEVSFYAEIWFEQSPDENLLNSCFSVPMNFGGEGRQVQTQCDNEVVKWPMHEGRRSTLVLITPGIFPNPDN